MDTLNGSNLMLKEALSNKTFTSTIAKYVGLENIVLVSPNCNSRHVCQIGEVFFYEDERIGVKIDSDLWLIYFLGSQPYIQNNKPWWVNCEEFFGCK